MDTFFGIVTDTDCCSAAGTLTVRAGRFVPSSSTAFGVLGRVGFSSGSLDCFGFFGTATLAVLVEMLLLELLNY